MSDNLNLPHLRALHAAATPGELFLLAEKDGKPRKRVLCGSSEQVYEASAPNQCFWVGLFVSEADAAAYIAIHNAFPALADRLEAAEAKYETLTQLCVATEERERVAIAHAIELRQERDAALYVIQLQGHTTAEADKLLATRDARMKALGALQEIESLKSNWHDMPLDEFIKQRAARKRREAGSDERFAEHA